MGPQSHWLLSRLPTEQASWFRFGVCLPMKHSLSPTTNPAHIRLSVHLRDGPCGKSGLGWKTTKTKGTKGTKPGRQQLVQHAEQEGILQHMLKAKQMV